MINSFFGHHVQITGHGKLCVYSFVSFDYYSKVVNFQTLRNVQISFLTLFGKILPNNIQQQENIEYNNKEKLVFK